MPQGLICSKIVATNDMTKISRGCILRWLVIEINEVVINVEDSIKEKNKKEINYIFSYANNLRALHVN